MNRFREVSIAFYSFLNNMLRIEMFTKTAFDYTYQSFNKSTVYPRRLFVEGSLSCAPLCRLCFVCLQCVAVFNIRTGSYQQKTSTWNGTNKEVIRDMRSKVGGEDGWLKFDEFSLELRESRAHCAWCPNLVRLIWASFVNNVRRSSSITLKILRRA